LATFDLLIDDGNNNSFDHETLAQGDLGMTDTIVITTLKTGSTTTFGPVLVAETTADGAETLPGSVTIPASIPNFQTFWSCDDTGGTNGTGTSIEVPTLLSGEDVTCTVTNVPVAQAACTP
jgi:hypothetical protein